MSGRGREPDPWWAALSYYALAPVFVPIFIVFFKDELEWPRWLSFWINSNFEWDCKK